MRTKSLHGLPWRYAIGCIDGAADPEGKGWILRAEIIWEKPNGLPESVRDRVRKSHERFFHFVKQPKYFATIDAVREPHAAHTLYCADWEADRHDGAYVRDRTNTNRQDGGSRVGAGPHPFGKIPGSVWNIASEPLTVPDDLDVDHFAAFPTEWPRRLILGWCPESVCVVCDQGRTPVFERPEGEDNNAHERGGNGLKINGDDYYAHAEARQAATHLIGWACGCPTAEAPTKPGVVLDPFGGTGTTALVAQALGRVAVSVDMSADYCRLAQWRINESGHDIKVVRRTEGDTVARSVAEQRDAAKAGQGRLI